MLREIYNTRKEVIDFAIKDAFKMAKDKLYEIDYETNKEIINKLEENYSIKMALICEEVYIQGLKDGINLIDECRKINS